MAQSREELMELIALEDNAMRVAIMDLDVNKARDHLVRMDNLKRKVKRLNAKNN